MNRLSRDASGSYEYYHSDGLGSTRQLSNDSQSVTQTTTYDAFGNIESSAGSSNNVYKYAGQFGYRSDGDDGLMHMGARDYDPLVGRFISADTYLGAVGNPQSLNRYVYVENSPINGVDPTGHLTWWQAGLLGVAVGGAIVLTGGLLVGAGIVANTALSGGIIGAIGWGAGGAVAGGLTNGVSGDWSWSWPGAGIGAATGAVGGFVGGWLTGPALTPEAQGAVNGMKNLFIRAVDAIEEYGRYMPPIP